MRKKWLKKNRKISEKQYVRVRGTNNIANDIDMFNRLIVR
jgi:hypothetical protein